MKELAQEFPPVRHGIHIGSIPSTSFTHLMGFTRVCAIWHGGVALVRRAAGLVTSLLASVGGHEINLGGTFKFLHRHLGPVNKH